MGKWLFKNDAYNHHFSLSQQVNRTVENVEYEPEQFPGLVYQVKDPKLVVLLFSSRKIIITGGKNLEDIKKGVDVIEKKLENIL
jgi:transcription initiation factor TFIID TATA-box-binding protein